MMRDVALAARLTVLVLDLLLWRIPPEPLLVGFSHRAIALVNLRDAPAIAWPHSPNENKQS